MKHLSSTPITDLIAIEMLLADPLHKTADGSIVSTIIDTVKNYVEAHIDPNNKVGSISSIILPGVLRALIGGPMGLLVGLALSVFHIEIGKMVGSVWDSLKELVSGDKKITSEAVDQAVDNVVAQHSTPSTPEQDQQADEYLRKNQSLQTIRQVKLAMIEYQTLQAKGINPETNLVVYGATGKAGVASALGVFLRWIFKILLGSAGLLVAGDAINSMLKRPNVFDKTEQHGKPAPSATESNQPACPTPKQTKFPLNSGYSNTPKVSPWEVGTLNNAGSIENMLVDFTKAVYDGLDGLEGAIKSSPAFQVVKRRIVNYNRASEGSDVVMIPKLFNNEKQIVDCFIDDVAKNTP